MSVKIYNHTSKTYQELTVPESYVFKRKREEVRLDVVDDLTLKFGIEYISRIGAPQSNFVAFFSPGLMLSNDFNDCTKQGKLRYLRHVARCRDILAEGSSAFKYRFSESLAPLDKIIGCFEYELQRYN